MACKNKANRMIKYHYIRRMGVNIKKLLYCKSMKNLFILNVVLKWIWTFFNGFFFSVKAQPKVV